MPIESTSVYNNVMTGLSDCLNKTLQRTRNEKNEMVTFSGIELSEICVEQRKLTISIKSDNLYTQMIAVC